MKIGNVSSLQSVYWETLTNIPATTMTPMQILGTNTLWLKASIGNTTHYYRTFSIFFYSVLQYPQCHPNTHPFILSCNMNIFFHILHCFLSFCTFDMHFCSVYFVLCNSFLYDCHFHISVAVLISATGGARYNKRNATMWTSSLWVQQGKPVECNSPQ